MFRLLTGSLLLICSYSALCAQDIHFKCVASESAFRPLALNGYPYPLGASPMPEEHCQQSLKYSRHGVICAYTGLGWKPAVGFKNPSRPHGHSYVGGSSMQGRSGYDACLKSTLNASQNEVCYFANDWQQYNGQRQWAIGTTDGTFKSRGYPLSTLEECLRAIHGTSYSIKELADAL